MNLETTPCKGCGRPMIWAETEDGKRIPLDPRPAVYRIDLVTGKPRATLMKKGGEAEFMVSHFATCPKAGAFSAGKKA